MRQRSKGSWRITVSAGADPITGKRRQISETVRGTKDVAEQALTRMLGRVDRGLIADPGATTVGDLLERWLAYVEVRTKRPLRPRTLERYQGIVRGDLIPSLGTVRLRKLTTDALEAYYGKLLTSGRKSGRGGLSPRTVRHVHAVLSAALERGVRWGLLAANPAESAEVPTAERRRFVMVTPELAGKILSDVQGTDLEILVTLAIGTGMRLGEVLGLRWQDVDLEARSGQVRQTAQILIGRGVVFSEPKTEKSRRTVPLPAFVVEALRRHRVEQAQRRLLAGEAWRDHDLIVERGDGRPWVTYDASHAWQSFAKRCGLDGVRFHDLRHRYATLMLAGGEDLKVVSELMGHTTITITADVYQDVIPRLKREAADRLDSVIAGASG